MSQFFQIVGVTQVRTLGVIYCLLILLGVVVSLLSAYQSRQSPPINWSRKFPHGLSKPMLALEFVRTVEDIGQIVGDQPDVRREKMLAALKIDTFGFIPIYWLFFLSLSWVLAHRPISNAVMLGIAVAVFATVAAVFDYAENYHLRVALETPLSQTAVKTVTGIYHASLLKWAAIFAALTLMSGLFLGRHDLLAWIGILLLLTSLLGFMGLVYHPAIEWSSVLLLITLVTLSIIFAVFPARFLQHF